MEKYRYVKCDFCDRIFEGDLFEVLSTKLACTVYATGIICGSGSEFAGKKFIFKRPMTDIDLFENACDNCVRFWLEQDLLIPYEDG